MALFRRILSKERGKFKIGDVFYPVLADGSLGSKRVCIGKHHDLIMLHCSFGFYPCFENDLIRDINNGVYILFEGYTEKIRDLL